MCAWAVGAEARYVVDAGRRTLCGVRSASFVGRFAALQGRFGQWLVIGCTAVAVSACASAEADSGEDSGVGAETDGAAMATPPAEPEIQLSAQLLTSRRDEANGQIRIRLTNLGEQPVPLDAIMLDAEPYSPDPARINTSELAPGQTVAYPVVHGSPTCVGDEPTPGPVAVEVVSGGREVSVDPGDSAALIARMLTLACGRERVAELVTIEFDDDWEWTEGTAEQTGTLLLTRRQAGPPLELTGVRGGVNYTLEQLEPGPVTVEEDASEVRVPIRTRAARCEAHAMADNSKPYGFTTFFSIDGGPDINVEFSAPDQRDNLDRLCLHSDE